MRLHCFTVNTLLSDHSGKLSFTTWSGVRLLFQYQIMQIYYSNYQYYNKKYTNKILLSNVIAEEVNHSSETSIPPMPSEDILVVFLLSSGTRYKSYLFCQLVRIVWRQRMCKNVWAIHMCHTSLISCAQLSQKHQLLQYSKSHVVLVCTAFDIMPRTRQILIRFTHWKLWFVGTKQGFELMRENYLQCRRYALESAAE